MTIKPDGETIVTYTVHDPLVERAEACRHCGGWVATTTLEHYFSHKQEQARLPQRDQITNLQLLGNVGAGRKLVFDWG